MAALCLYSHDLDTGEPGRPTYDQAEAERFSRALLMPTEAFARSPVGATPSSPSCSLPRSTRSRSAAARREAKTGPPSAKGCAPTHGARPPRRLGKSHRKPAPAAPGRALLLVVRILALAGSTALWEPGPSATSEGDRATP